MAIFQGLLFLFFGVGVGYMLYRSLSTGWLPLGPNGLKGRLEVQKETQPLAFWIVFFLYGAASLWLLIFSIQLLLGYEDPLPLQ